MICDVCGCEPCQTPGFCMSCRKVDGVEVNGVAVLSYNDFYLHSEQHQYIYLPTGRLWPSSTINTRLAKREGLKPSTWIDKHQAVEQMTWFPGEPTLVKNKLFKEGDWVKHEGALVYNHYRKPTVELGDAAGAQPWIDHVVYVYPDNAEWIIPWCAHRAQHPNIKINHALVFGGMQGIGKDTLLAPVRIAVGHWNCQSITPGQLAGNFTGFFKTTLLCVSEARDVGEVSRYGLYDHTKIIIAAPPDVLRVNEKNTHEYYIPNLCGVVFTTNYKAGGIYLPADDRRHYVCWSDRTPADFSDGYWHELWRYYENGGYQDVAAYLMSYDLSKFNPKGFPPKTQAFWEMVNSHRDPEASDLATALDHLGSPTAVCLSKIYNAPGVDEDFKKRLQDPRSRRSLARRFEECGYVAVVNPDADNGLWRIDGVKQMAYAIRSIPAAERLEAARRLGWRGA
jgi:hypothetical protein